MKYLTLQKPFTLSADKALALSQLFLHRFIPNLKTFSKTTKPPVLTSSQNTELQPSNMSKAGTIVNTHHKLQPLNFFSSII